MEAVPVLHRVDVGAHGRAYTIRPLPASKTAVQSRNPFPAVNRSAATGEVMGVLFSVTVAYDKANSPSEKLSRIVTAAGTGAAIPRTPRTVAAHHRGR